MGPTCLSRSASIVAGLSVLATLGVHAASGPRRAPAAALEPIAINDNRAAAGMRDADLVTIRLEAREGAWHPEGETDGMLIVCAFAEEGGPLRIPGPLIRVVEGTRIRVVIRNRLDQPLASRAVHAACEG